MKTLLLTTLILATLLISCNLFKDCPECPKPEKPELYLIKSEYNYVSFSWDQETLCCKIYKNGELIAMTEGSGWDEFGEVEPEKEYKYIVELFGFNGMASDTLIIKTPRDPKPLGFEWVDIRLDSLGNNYFYYLSWQSKEPDNVLWYVVMRNGVQISPKLSTPYFMDTSIEGGMTYTYRIIAANEAGQTASEDVIKETPISETVPNAPTNFTLQKRGFNELEITWDLFDNADEYYIQNNVTGDIFSTPLTFVKDTGLEHATLYGFSAWCSNEIGSSDTAHFEFETRGKFMAKWNQSKDWKKAWRDSCECWVDSLGWANGYLLIAFLPSDTFFVNPVDTVYNGPDNDVLIVLDKEYCFKAVAYDDASPINYSDMSQDVACTESVNW